MVEKLKNRILLKYGPREDEALKDISELAKQGVLPDNTNEILRRGLHSVRNLAEVNEKPLLALLFENLNLAIKMNSPDRLDISQALAFAVLATLVTKYGLPRSETFESIPKEIKEARNYYVHNKKFDQALSKALGEVATGVDTVFIKHPISKKPTSVSNHASDATD